MFDKSKDLITKDSETIIGHSIKVKGDFQGQGNITIEGELEGSILTNNNLLVGDKARIKASSVQAKDAKISGTIIGNLIIKGYLEITKTAKITGDIAAAQISIEKGASINGNCSSGAQSTLQNDQINK